MKALFAILGLLLNGCAESQRADLAIRGATVVDVTDGSLLTDQNVLIEDNRIVAVGPRDGVQVPGGAEVVEAEGKYLIPGLWDMHVHSVRSGDWHFPLFLAHGVTGVRDMSDGTGDVRLGATNSVNSTTLFVNA